MTFLYDENQRNRGMLSNREIWIREAIAAGQGTRYRRDTKKNPRITGLIPRNGSPMGGLIITITGEHLKSKQLDLGTGQAEESEEEGENFKVWFERDGFKVRV